MPHGIEHFTDGVADTGADVESTTRETVDVLKGSDVSIGNVEYVNIIADAGAVWCRIISTKDRNPRMARLDGMQHKRDKMGFVAAGFAAMLGGAGNIEIAERNVVQAGIFAIISENILKSEFGFAVRVDGQLRMVLGNGDDARLSIDGASGGKNKLIDAVA
jgi:hypothetical protein